jgi:hypothetical protein
VSVPLDIPQLAKRIIAHALRQGRGSSAEIVDSAEALEQAFAAFAQHVGTMIGEIGFNALLARALHLTRASLGTNASGALLPDSVPSWRDMQERTDPDTTAECATQLLGHVLGLLSSLIGEDLTMRLVRRTWTDLDTGGSKPASGGRLEP